MVYKSKVCVFIFLFSLILCSTFLYAQELEQNNEELVTPENATLLNNGLLLLEDGTIVDAQTLLPIEEKDYEILETDEGVIFIQTLSWVEAEYALRYEVLLERQQDDGLWSLVDRYSTEQNKLELSIFAGTYRYKVFVYNFLDLLEAESDWFEFKVFKAIQPGVFDLSPDLLYLDEEQTGIFQFKGINALDETLFTIEIPGSPRRTVFGEIIEQNDDNYRIQFDMGKIDTGSYIFKAENPGGLTDTFGPLDVRFLKPYDFDVTVGYNVFITLPGDIPLYFNKNLYPFGSNLKITYIPLKRNFGQIGFELSTYWFLMKNTFDTYDVSTHVIPTTLNFVYQYPIVKKRFIFDSHVGVGTTFLADIQFEFSNGIESPSQTALGLTANAGIAFQLYVMNRLFFELSGDYLLTFLQGTTFHLVTPSLSVGWQF